MDRAFDQQELVDSNQTASFLDICPVMSRLKWETYVVWQKET